MPAVNVCSGPALQMGLGVDAPVRGGGDVVEPGHIGRCNLDGRGEPERPQSVRVGRHDDAAGRAVGAEGHHDLALRSDRDVAEGTGIGAGHRLGRPEGADDTESGVGGTDHGVDPAAVVGDPHAVVSRRHHRLVGQVGQGQLVGEGGAAIGRQGEVGVAGGARAEVRHEQVAERVEGDRRVPPRRGSSSAEQMQVATRLWDQAAPPSLERAPSRLPVSSRASTNIRSGFVRSMATEPWDWLPTALLRLTLAPTVIAGAGPAASATDGPTTSAEAEPREISAMTRAMGPRELKRVVLLLIRAMPSFVVQPSESVRRTVSAVVKPGNLTGTMTGGRHARPRARHRRRPPAVRRPVPLPAIKASDDASVDHDPYSWIMSERSDEPRHGSAMAVAPVTRVGGAHGRTGSLRTGPGGFRKNVLCRRSRVTVANGRLPVGA